MGVCPISAWTHSASDLYMFVPLVQNSTISIPPNKFQSHLANFNPTQQISIPPRNQFIFRGQLNFSEFSYGHHPVLAVWCQKWQLTPQALKCDCVVFENTGFTRPELQFSGEVLLVKRCLLGLLAQPPRELASTCRAKGGEGCKM